MFTKKPKVKNVRNILQSPFHMQWSEKSGDEIIPIRNALQELLPAAKLEQVDLKKQCKIKKGNKDAPNTERQQNSYRKFLTPGFQSVIRGLEKKDLCCVILAGNITPLLQKVLLAYTQINSVPVTVIPDLKRVTKSALGFPSMVLGFKTAVADSENKFFPIYSLVSQNPIYFGKTLPSESEDVDMDQTDKSCEPSKPQIKTEPEYLYREQIGERVFIPGLKTKASDTINNEKEKGNFDSFISLKGASEKISRPTAENKRYDLKDTSDSDDSDSDIDNAFFVDTQQDVALLSTKNVNHNKSDNKNIPQSKKTKFKNKTQKGISYNMSNTDHVGPKLGINSSLNRTQNSKHFTKKSQIKSTFSDMPNEFKTSKTQNKSRHLLPKESQQLTLSRNLPLVNFNPLKIKTVMINPNKVRRKKIKKPNV